MIRQAPLQYLCAITDHIRRKRNKTELQLGVIDQSIKDRCQPGLTTIELLLNSVIYSAGARFMIEDVRKIYFNAPIKDTEYMRILIKLTPNDIREKYKTSEFEHGGYAYVQVKKGMY